MSTGLKDELGLDEPKAGESSQQADQFKAAFQAEMSKVNSCLQYTAAHAETEKHGPIDSERTSCCSSYQSASGKIDPSNTATAQSAIEQVLNGVKALAKTAQTLKDAVEKAFTAWTEQQPDFDSVSEKIREMVEWGFEQASTLQQVVDDILAKANLRKYAEALQALQELLVNAASCYEEFLRQKTAKDDYEAELPALESELGDAATCEYPSLEAMQLDIATAADKMRETAANKDFVSALDQMNAIKTNLDTYKTELAKLETNKEEYETARDVLEPRLTEASTSEYEWLADLNQEIADLTTRMEEAATAGDFEQALEVVGQLSGKVDEKLQRVAEKEEFDQARAALEPRLTEASTSRHESLAKLDEQVASLTTKMEQAVAANDYGLALQIVSELAAKVEEKLAEEGRIDRKIVGSAQKARADKKLEALDEESRKRFNKLAEAAKSPEELDYLTKSLASNYSMDEIEEFAKKIHGKDKDWLQNNLRLTGNTDGEGVKQQWSFSCNATTTQAVRGELDPIYALKLHEENADLTDADDADATKMNPKLAEEQREMLESEYSGPAADPHTGVATSRDDPEGKGRGRWADDLMNDMSETTGVEYANKQVDGTYKNEDAVADVEAGVKQGHPVPLVVGDSKDDFAHYVLVTGRDEGPPPTWTIHDPGSGKTVTRNVEDIKKGNINVGGYKQITALENPSTKE